MLVALKIVHTNLDIYVPRWLAKHNKGIFGSLFFAGVAYCLFKWLR